jgi:methyl-accepting chemotaxis protein
LIFNRRNFGLQTRFMVLAGAGVLILAAATIALISWFEFANLEERLRAFSQNELQSLNALVESAMEQRLEDPQNVAIKVFNGWFDSRNKDYPGRLWSVWSPMVIAYMAKTAPERAAKMPLDSIDQEALRTGQPIERFVAGAYRYSLPIILDKTLAAPKESCDGCHADAVGQRAGDVIAVFSSSISTDKDIGALHQLLLLMAAGTLFGGLLVIAGIRLIFGRIITRPLTGMTKAMRHLADGDRTIEVPAQDRLDEIGEMAKAVLVFRDAAVENARLEQEAAEHRVQLERERECNDQAQRKAIQQERAIVADSIGVALAKLAIKDLTYRMSSDLPEAYRQLQSDFNAAIAQLEEAMWSVTDSTRVILSGTEEISMAADDLSRRTEQQAASLEETAAALEEITATIKKSAEGASHARQIVVTTDGDAKKSAQVVRQAVEAMDGIAKSAQQISQIIGVIDEIAFQTNLLALNAGVEAARAGDAGRGFAVVASEVRALAQRSTEAAKEIKGLITASTRQVESGVKLVGETGASLERIMAQVSDINAVVGNIAVGAKEQATGIGEVNTAINQMDQMTQQNAAMVEESTAATHSLSQETAQLSGLIGQFQVGRTDNNASMRRELQKVAPHAFRQKPEAAAPKGARAETSKAAARPLRARPKAMVANGRHGSAADDGWKEF